MRLQTLANSKLLLVCTNFLLLSRADNCLAQTPAFTWSEKFTTKGHFRFAGSVGSNMYAIQNHGNKEVMVRHFGPGLKESRDRRIQFGTSDNPGIFLTSFVADTGLVNIQCVFDKKKDSLIISTASSTLSSMKAGSTSFAQAFYAEDRSKLLICNFYYNRKTKHTERDFIVLATSTAKVLYEGTFSINTIEETAGEIMVDNQGNTYFGSTSYQRIGSKLSGKTHPVQQVTIFAPDGRSMVWRVDFPGRYIPGVDIIQEDNNTVYIAGFVYDEAIRATRITDADLFLYRLDPLKLAFRDSLYTTVKGLYPEGKLKEDDRLTYTIRHIYEKTSGGVVVIAEQYKQITNQYGSREMYNDIACIPINAAQNVGSIVRIPKLQFDFDNPSFLSTFINDKVFLLYNDLQENLAVSGEMVKNVANKKEKNGLFLVTIGSDNQYKKELLYGYETGQPMPVLQAGYVMDKGKIFLCSDEQVGIVQFMN